MPCARLAPLISLSLRPGFAGPYANPYRHTDQRTRAIPRRPQRSAEERAALPFTGWPQAVSKGRHPLCFLFTKAVLVLISVRPGEEQ